MIAALFCAVNTKAQKYNQFVKWENVITNPSVDQIASWLKKAMAGEPISGAAVRSKKENFVSVWGEDLYDQIATADKTKFFLGKSVGGEQNFAIDPNTNITVASGTLKPETLVIGFKQGENIIPVAKWGTNGCLNPLLPGNSSTSVDETDEDVTFDNKKTIKSKNTTTGNNEISWEDGYNIYKKGRNDRTDDMLDDAAIYARIQSIGNNSNNGASCSTCQQSSVVQPQTAVYYGDEEHQSFGGRILNDVVDGVATGFGLGVGNNLGNRLFNRNNVVVRGSYSSYGRGGRMGGGRIFHSPTRGGGGRNTAGPRRYNESSLSGIVPRGGGRRGG